MIEAIVASATTALILGLGITAIIHISNLRGQIDYQKDLYNEISVSTKLIENERDRAISELKSIKHILTAIQDQPLIAMLNEKQAAELIHATLSYLEANSKPSKLN